MPVTHTYKSLVAAHLRCLAEQESLTHQQVAERLGLSNGNYISMLSKPRTNDILAFTRIPALKQCCDLGAEDVLELVLRRVADHPDKPVRFNEEVLKLLVHCVVEVVDARRAAKTTGAAHGH